MRRVLSWSLVGLLAACDQPGRSAVTVSGGPLLEVREGVSAQFAVSIEPEADPETTADFALEVDPAHAALFDTLAIAEGEGGVPVVAVTAACAAVAAGQTDAIVPVRVRAVPAGRADPYDVMVDVTGDGSGACAPLVAVWAGDCLELPASPVDALAIPIGPQPPALCAHVASRDPASERYWVRATTTAPVELIDPQHLPGADEVAEADFVIPLGDTSAIRGAFELTVTAFPADPVLAAPPAAASADLLMTVGEPGDVALQLLSAAGGVEEFGVGSFAFRVWNYPEPPPADPICVSATRITEIENPMARTKPFLRLYDVIDTAVTDGEWLCGSGVFTLRASPPIDSAPVEEVRIEAGACPLGQCPPPGTGTESALLDLSFDSISLADELTCSGFDVSRAPIVACMDIFGDSTPEVFVQTSFGLSCTFPGYAQRFPIVLEGDIVAIADTAPPEMEGIAQAQAKVAPVGILALSWSSGPAMPAKELLLGEFVGGVQGMKVFEISVVDGQHVAFWRPADELGFAPDTTIALEFAQPVAAADVDGATHLAFPTRAADQTIEVTLRCVSPAWTGCQDVLLKDLAPPGHAVAGLVSADMDGNGGADLVLFTRTATELYPTALLLDWTDDPVAPRLGQAVPFAAVTVGGDLVRAAAGPGAGTAENLYFQVRENTPQAFLYRIEGSNAFSAHGLLGAEHRVITPGPVLGLTAHAGGLVVAMPLGVWRFVDGMNQNSNQWSLLDPVLQEQASAGQLPVPPTDYGAALAACGATGSVVFSSSQTTARWTATDITAAEP